MREALPVVNLAEARYECTYGRGCIGHCCRVGKPPVYPDEVALLDENLPRILPRLRPEAHALLEKETYLTRRQRIGLPTVRIVQGWCVFFNEGCVLHRLGEEEGDKFRYKPCVCSLFPLTKGDDDQWYIRQRGFNQEKWDLFCLDPQASPMPAAESLQEEMKLALSYS